MRSTVNALPSSNPIDKLKRPEDDVLRDLAHYEETRKYLTDTGFREGLAKLRSGDPEEIRQVMASDPRIAQAVGFMSGMAIDVSDQDIRAAERVGDIRKRDAIQFPDLELASEHASAADAKAAGNEHFKKGQHTMALACYQRALGILTEPSGGDESDDDAMTWDELQARDAAKLEQRATVATLHSNSAMALLRLAVEHIERLRPDQAPERYREALEHCERALAGAPRGFDVSKLYFRKALALEGLRRYQDAAETMEVGRRAAKLSGDTQAEERIRRELRRLQRAEKAQDAIVEAAVAQKRREAVAAAAREAGLALEQAAADAKAAAGVSRATAGDPIRCAPSNPFASVQELDFSFWSEKALAARLANLRHERCGTIIIVEGLDLARSQVHASIKSKRGQGKSLFYDLDLMLTWVGHCNLGCDHQGAGRMEGEFRLYNVGQDTKFEVDGDMHTSYLYSLGFPVQYHNDDGCELWARQVKFEAAELFELVSRVVTKWVDDLVAKAIGQQ